MALRAPLIGSSIAVASASDHQENPADLRQQQDRDREHHRECSSKLTTFDRTLVVK
jgi:hypothetical protein